MTRSLSKTVDAAHAGMRIDAYLAEMGCYRSRSAAARFIEEGKVFVGGATPTKKTLLNAGDTIVYEEEQQDEHIPLQGEPIPLDIRFEDDWLMVISKQAGLCVHPSEGHESSTLVNALIYHYGRDQLAHIQGDDRPGIVHRLDMDTSGLMLCAKDDEVALKLQEDIRERTVDRRYLALVHGNIAHDTGQIDAPIARSVRERVRMAVNDSASARPAQTSFSVLERFEASARDEGYTLLECKLATGRTHQIRVHMEYIRHCCVGDPLYRQGNDTVQLGLARQFLHSHSLSFTHPATHEQLSFFDTLPGDLSSALESIEERSMGRTSYGEQILKRVAG